MASSSTIHTVPVVFDISINDPTFTHFSKSRVKYNFNTLSNHSIEYIKQADIEADVSGIRVYSGVTNHKSLGFDTLQYNYQDVVITAKQAITLNQKTMQMGIYRNTHIH